MSAEKNSRSAENSQLALGLHGFEGKGGSGVSLQEFSLPKTGPDASARPRGLRDFRSLVLSFLAMVFALSCLAETRPVFRSPTIDASLGFHPLRSAGERALARALASQPEKRVLCTCRVLTHDQRTLYRTSEKLSGAPSSANCTDKPEQLALPQGPVVRVEKISLAACEAMDGKTYRSEGGAPVACAKAPCRVPAGSGPVGTAAAQCEPFNPEKTPAFWYCQASAQ